MIQRLQFIAIVFISDAIVVTTEERLKLAKKISPNKIYKIPVGPNFEINIKKNIRKKEKLILTTLGTLQVEGDYFTILRGLKLLKKEIKNIELRIIGHIDTTFPVYRQIKEKIKDLNLLNNVKWFINVPRWRVIDLLLETDIYLFIRKEGPTGRSTTLALALALGLPIIAYEGENVEPMFKHKENIILIPQNGVKEWKEGVLSIITDAELKEKLKTNSRKLFQKYFCWDKIVKSYEKIFERIA
jgi:glycosyltransferase involved in cell wall biosynthesis